MAGHFAAPARASSCEIVSVLDGSATLTAGNSTLEMGQGDTAVIPAVMEGYTLEGSGARVVCSYVPTADEAIILAWQDAQR